MGRDQISAAIAELLAKFYNPTALKEMREQVCVFVTQKPYRQKTWKELALRSRWSHKVKKEKKKNNGDCKKTRQAEKV